MNLLRHFIKGFIYGIFIALIMHILSSCGKSGKDDRRTTTTMQSCVITSDEVTCGEAVFPVPQRTCEVEVEDVEPAPPPSDDPVPEVPVPTEDLIVEDEAEDMTSETLDTPVVITYHGTICNNVPVVQLDTQLFVIYGSQLSIITQEEAVVWESVTRKGEVNGCYVKLNGDGQVEARFLSADNHKKPKKDKKDD